MRIRAFLLVAVLAATPAACQAGDKAIASVGTAGEGSTVDPAHAMWTGKGLPLLETYCIECHNRDFQEAELNLESYPTAKSVMEHRDHWEKILERVRFETMPPEDTAQPSDEERAALVVAIETLIYGTACDLDPKPGRVTVRRLNRAEYNNTIRDLFGIDGLRPADEFPSDEVGAGFDNNGDVLSLPPMLFEKYVAAAEQVAAAVVIDPDAVSRINAERSGDSLHWIGPRRIGSFYKHFLHDGSVSWAEFEFLPFAGRYELRIAGSSVREGEIVTLAAFDETGRPLGSVDVEYADEGGSHSRSLKLDLQAGSRRVFVTRVPSKEEIPEVLQAAVDLDEPTIAEARARVGKPLEVDHDFNRDEISFAVKSLTLAGPQGIPDSLLGEGHRRLIQQRPGRKRSVADAARPGVEWLLTQAFRGPVDDATIDAYVELVTLAEQREDNFERAMRVAVTAALVSPRFLFRAEAPSEEPGPDGTVPLTSYQIASRLSYFLWSSMPDESLMELAAEDRLQDDAVIREQVQRMLSDPRSEALADNFAAQWFGLRNLDSIEPDPTQFTTFDDSLREAMRQETRLLFLDILRQDRSVLDLIDADHSFLNQRLAEHYGVEEVHGDEFRKVSLEGTPRRGILTHASILALTSNPTRTSPVKRGKWIMENLLGTPPPDPPAGVPELEETGSTNPNASFREQLEIHRSDQACASCHRVMDPLGFGFENFDAVGGYRRTDGQHMVDASGELPGGIAFEGALDLIQVLRTRYAEQFAHTAAERMLTFALGRELRFEDRCVVDGIVRKASEQDFRFSALATEVVLSPAFRLITPEGDE